MARSPLISPGPLVYWPGLNTWHSVFCLPFSSSGAGWGALGPPHSGDECPLIACIDSPSEALAWLLINPPSGCSMLSGYSAPYLLLQFNKLVTKTCWYKIHMYWIWLSWGCSCMSNLLALVAGTTLDYCVRVLLMGSLCAHFFGNVSAVTYIASRQKLYRPTHHLLHALSCTTASCQNRNLCHSGTLSNYKEQFPLLNISRLVAWVKTNFLTGKK